MTSKSTTSDWAHASCARARPYAIAAIALTLMSSAATAQADSVGSPEWKARSCAAAAATLSQSGPEGRAFSTALASVQSCPEEGPGTLARLWKTPPSDSASRHVLSSVSGRVRDQRLFDALVEAASNESFGTAARLDAIAALAEETDSTLVVEFRQPPSHARSPGPRVEILRLTHAASETGAHPLGRDVAARVVRFLRGLSATDSDPAVRYVSGVIAPTLASTKP